MLRVALGEERMRDMWIRQHPERTERDDVGDCDRDLGLRRRNRGRGGSDGRDLCEKEPPFEPVSPGSRRRRLRRRRSRSRRPAARRASASGPRAPRASGSRRRRRRRCTRPRGPGGKKSGNKVHPWPDPVWIVALIITVVQPSARTCAALSFAPTSTMPDRKMVDVANLSPGAIASRTAAGAALAAAAPRTMLAGTELTCQSAGRLLATTAPPPAVHAAAARPVADDVRATRRRRDSSTRRRNLSTRLVNVVAAASPRLPEASVVDAGGGRVRVWLAGRAC